MCGIAGIVVHTARYASDEIRAQVIRWETNVSLNWNDSDIDVVTTYLARTFYKVPCPVC